MSETARQAWAILRDPPHLVADSMWRWAYRQHAPYDLNGDGSRAVCVACREDWPCRKWQRLDDDRVRAGHEFRA